MDWTGRKIVREKEKRTVAEIISARISITSIVTRLTGERTKKPKKVNEEAIYPKVIPFPRSPEWKERGDRTYPKRALRKEWSFAEGGEKETSH